MDPIEEFLRHSNYIEGEYSEEAYEDAKKAWDYLISQNVLTLDVICKTHKILMERRPLEEKYKGHFREIPVYVGRRECTSWKMVPMLLQNWVFETMRAHPKVDSIDLHVKYEKIHPFADGNGRTGRMFMNWTRLKRNNEPLLIIHEGEEQREYYGWFK